MLNSTTASFQNAASRSSTTVAPPHELHARYHSVLGNEVLPWTTHYRKVRQLGTGGQGVVYLAERRGSDGFARPVALKVFSPDPYARLEDYIEDMSHVAHVAARVSVIQHDNLVEVHNFFAVDGIRVMALEYLEGHDISEVLDPQMLALTRERVSAERFDYINNVILTPGPAHSRIKPGVAIQVLRECLAGLSALHRQGIAHGDLKPSNIMLKRTGNAKIIDIGSAVDLSRGPVRRMWSPVYAAPEVLEGGPNSPKADLASLGYILVEMLSGQSPFQGLNAYRELVDAKKRLDRELPDLLPHEVSGNELLLNLCQRLIAPDPDRRFANALAADIGRKGAADFHRQLIKGDLSSEYENEIRVWLEQVA
jgi:serine/threonine-protein kinase